MRGRSLFLLVASVGTLALSACSTLVNHSDQTVDVVVKGSPSASCDFTTSVHKNSGTFPNKLVIERSHEPLLAECRGEQNLYKKFEIKSTLTDETVGNVFTGVVPGLAYDTASGGMWEYPDPIIVDFRVVGAGPKPDWPAEPHDDLTRVGVAEITPPAPIRMKPVMDEDLNPALSNQVRATSPKTEIIDAVRLATDGKTKTVTSGKPINIKPVISPEDYMGADPAKVKAAADAKRKAAEDAKRRAAAKKEEAAQRAKAEAERKMAEEAAAMKAKTLEETEQATPPSDADAQPEAMPEPTVPIPTVEPAAEPAVETPATDDGSVPETSLLPDLPEVDTDAAVEAVKDAAETVTEKAEDAAEAVNEKAKDAMDSMDRYLTEDDEGSPSAF